MRQAILAAVLLLGACQVTTDHENDSVAVSLNKEVAADAANDVGNVATNVASDISNDVQREADKVQQNDGDVASNGTDGNAAN